MCAVQAMTERATTPSRRDSQLRDRPTSEANSSEREREKKRKKKGKKNKKNLAPRPALRSKTGCVGGRCACPLVFGFFPLGVLRGSLSFSFSFPSCSSFLSLFVLCRSCFACACACAVGGVSVVGCVVGFGCSVGVSPSCVGRWWWCVCGGCAVAVCGSSGVVPVRWLAVVRGGAAQRWGGLPPPLINLCECPMRE